MSQCHKCDKPCGHVLTFQIPSTLPYCVIGPVLEALPTASEEQIKAIDAILQVPLTEAQAMQIQHMVAMPSELFYWMPHPFEQCDCMIDAECECMGGGCSDYEPKIEWYFMSRWIVAEWLEAERCWTQRNKEAS